MKFNREEIIKACDYIIARHDDKESRRAATYELFKEEHKKKWMEQELPKWRAYRDAITKAIRSGKPITSESLGSFRHCQLYSEPYDGIRSFTWQGEHFKNRDFQDHEFTVRVKDILSAAMDDGITISELRSLRIAPTDIVNILEDYRASLKEAEAEERRKAELAKKKSEAAAEAEKKAADGEA